MKLGNLFTMNRKWLIISGIVLMVCVIGGLVALGQIGHGTQQVNGAVADAPYLIGKRPMPGTNDPNTLFPPIVGVFKRDTNVTNTPGTTGSTGTVTPTGLATIYSSGTDTVEATISIFSSAAEAQRYVVGLPKINASYVIYGTNANLTYAANGPQGGMSRLIYSRGPYLF